MDRYTLLYLKWITNKHLLYSTGNSAQCYAAAWMGVGFGGEWIHMYIHGWVPSLFTWNHHNIVGQLYSNIKVWFFLFFCFFFKFRERWKGILGSSGREGIHIVTEGGWVPRVSMPHWNLHSPFPYEQPSAPFCNPLKFQEMLKKKKKKNSGFFYIKTGWGR